MAMEECYLCGDAYESLGRHWAFSSQCKIPSLSDNQRDVFIGVLMSDGWIHIPQSKEHNPNFLCDMKESSLPYLRYLDEEIFQRIGLGIELLKDSEESAPRCTQAWI